MHEFGLMELFVLLFALILYGVPIAAGVWAVVTISRIHKGQKDIRDRLENIERALRNVFPQQ